MIENRMEKAIGGYMCFEDNNVSHYHTDALRLNTAKNCLEYILRLRQYKHVYIPYLTCEVIKNPFDKLGIKYTEYSVNEELEPSNLPDLKDGEAFLYTNYFGIKSSYISYLSARFGHKLIVDNAQAFFDYPVDGIDSFYSVRKFIGVSDGAYLYVDQKLKEEFPRDISFERLTHLFKRIDLDPESCYNDFKQIEQLLYNEPIKRMSLVTETILSGIDYKRIKERRKRNFLYLHNYLRDTNRLKFDVTADMVPLVYPFLSSDTTLKDKLINKRIFIPTYWPHIIEQSDKLSKEYEFSTHLIPLPIDQRYDERDMERIINLINIFYNER